MVLVITRTAKRATRELVRLKSLKRGQIVENRYRFISSVCFPKKGQLILKWAVPGYPVFVKSCYHADLFAFLLVYLLVSHIQRVCWSQE